MKHLMFAVVTTIALGLLVACGEVINDVDTGIPATPSPVAELMPTATPESTPGSQQTSDSESTATPTLGQWYVEATEEALAIIEEALKIVDNYLGGVSNFSTRLIAHMGLQSQAIRIGGVRDRDAIDGISNMSHMLIQADITSTIASFELYMSDESSENRDYIIRNRNTIAEGLGLDEEWDWAIPFESTDEESSAGLPTQDAGISLDDALSFGSAFEFDGFNITMGTTWEMTTVANRFSDFYGHDVIRVPIEITNISGDTATLRNPVFYDPDGLRLDNIHTFFRDYRPQSMRPDATATAHLHFLYVGDGEYWAIFSRVRERVEIKLYINH